MSCFASFSLISRCLGIGSIFFAVCVDVVIVSVSEKIPSVFLEKLYKVFSFHIVYLLIILYAFYAYLSIEFKKNTHRMRTE